VFGKENMSNNPLRTWLDSQGFGKFEDKLRDCGVGTLDDLRVLKSEDEIMELAGGNGINMGVVFRRKFIKAVLDLKDADIRVEIDTKIEPSETNTKSNNDANGNNNVPNPKSMSRKEEKALTELVQNIKTHTTKLKKTKEELTKTQKQSEDSKTEMVATFDKAMETLLVRRKSLEQMLQMAHDECSNKLTAQITVLQSSAKKLLLAQKELQNKLRDTPPSSDRETTIINGVNEALNDVPKSELDTMDIIFTQGEPELCTFIEQYGTIAIGKKK